MSKKYNFYKVLSHQRQNFTRKRNSHGLNRQGRKILRFRKPNQAYEKGGAIENFISNQSLIQFKQALSKKIRSLAYWIKAENYQTIVSQFYLHYKYTSWNSNRLWEPTLPSFNKLSFLATLLFSLRFLIKTFRFFLSKTFESSFNGFFLSSDERYWRYFPLAKSDLNYFWVGCSIHQGVYKNFYFSSTPDKNSIVLSKGRFLTKIQLPSRKIVFLETEKTKASKASIFSANRSQDVVSQSKASFKLTLGRKPTVRGKAMNIFDHPNGGYKHSSKLLKTFKGKKILK